MGEENKQAAQSTINTTYTSTSIKMNLQCISHYYMYVFIYKVGGVMGGVSLVEMRIGIELKGERSLASAREG